MIFYVHARNVNEALYEALHTIQSPGASDFVHTRNGPAHVLKGPLVTELRAPEERVLFWHLRDANPFFHLFESLWMLDGRNDVAFPAQFAKQILEYSDDGHTLAGAYGHRWRRKGPDGRDQLEMIAEALMDDPNTRRAVLQMWDMVPDLTDPGKDVPCNLIVAFDIRQNRLNAYISNRSNDMVWGLYGANAVHFSILLEYMARWIGVPVGTMTTFSVNAHIYPSLIKARKMLEGPDYFDHYRSAVAAPFPLMGTFTDVYEWDAMLRNFLISPGDDEPLPDPFFSGVAQPMYKAWRSWRDGNTERAIQLCDNIVASDWRIACTEWLFRRLKT